MPDVITDAKDKARRNRYFAALTLLIATLPSLVPTPFFGCLNYIFPAFAYYAIFRSYRLLDSRFLLRAAIFGWFWYLLPIAIVGFDSSAPPPMRGEIVFAIAMLAPTSLAGWLAKRAVTYERATRSTKAHADAR